ncbi:MAG: DUF1553 domain-containing protein [Acidobacteriaceae bacterium]|nr:DUF1553 domain-containing protein [Acidobacteriaceae bacterium]
MWRWLMGFVALSCLAQDKELDFGREVRPILSEKCFHCHGQDARTRMAGLRLDVAGADLRKVVERITATNPARRMPPPASKRSLEPAQIALLQRWVRQGGQYAQHWAFVPPRRPTPPPGAVNPIDAFVRQRLAAEGLRPNPPATPQAWLRRVSLDLTGLPPTPAELRDFTAALPGAGERAYQATVRRLLASPRFGERMAIDWLDVARYADTHGFNNDSERSMWRWRDWVVQAFNDNLPYNRFLTEQLAGDLLEKPTLEQRIATGFGRNHVINSEGGIIGEEYRVEYVADRVRTLGMAWLGLTFECARCHDHKYDPISQKDHYRMYAFFNNVPELGEDGRVANAVPILQAPTYEEKRQLAALDARIRRAEAQARPRPVPAIEAPGAKPLTPQEPVPLGKHDAVSFAFRVSGSAQDTELFSSIDYQRNMAATTYGRGLDVRLAGPEIEFRFADRLSAYAIIVRSAGAGLTPGRERHVAVLYEGAHDSAGAMRAYASWVRLFVDGREVETQILHDGLAMPERSLDKPQPTKFRVGPVKEAQFWNRALRAAEVRSLARLATADPELESLREQRLRIARRVATVMVMQELPGEPRPTHVLLRGQYNLPGERVEPGVPEALLGAWPAGAPRNRLGLAQWLTKPDHPLTARVVVNRFWQQFFGQGLVKTSENFGVQGESPSHPELLDWLAREFVDSGWNVKGLLEKIVLSATYRQEAAGSAESFARDPENRLLSRGPRFRLPAELIRDQSLFVSGLLEEKQGGPPVYPYQTRDLYKNMVVAATYPGTTWPEAQGADLYRRSLYTFWKRTVPHPTMTVFDAPDREFCVVRRSNTNTPLQALTLLNDPTFAEAARKLAERAWRAGGRTADSRLAFAFRLATGREPDGPELGTLRDLLTKMRQEYSADADRARQLLAVGASPAAADIAAPELAAYTSVANVILNLDEVITK